MHLFDLVSQTYVKDTFANGTLQRGASSTNICKKDKFCEYYYLIIICTFILKESLPEFCVTPRSYYIFVYFISK